MTNLDAQKYQCIFVFYNKLKMYHILNLQNKTMIYIIIIYFCYNNLLQVSGDIIENKEQEKKLMHKTTEDYADMKLETLE